MSSLHKTKQNPLLYVSKHSKNLNIYLQTIDQWTNTQLSWRRFNVNKHLGSSKIWKIWNKILVILLALILTKIPIFKSQGVEKSSCLPSRSKVSKSDIGSAYIL